MHIFREEGRCLHYHADSSIVSRQFSSRSKKRLVRTPPRAEHFTTVNAPPLFSIPPSNERPRRIPDYSLEWRCGQFIREFIGNGVRFEQCSVNEVIEFQITNVINRFLIQFKRS